MVIDFNLDTFISEKVIERKQSMFTNDLFDYNVELAKEIDQKSVLVIGGAGTIGSSFIKALLKFNPRRLYVVDINENGLTELVRDLRSSVGVNIPEDFKTYPINFSDEVFHKIYRREGDFDIIANFAAHKHVRSEKDEYSIEAMVRNNVINAKYLLDLISEKPPKHFFCVSTDKAANPVNVMGASKKFMEELIMAYTDRFKITTARFANVAFSNGSLLAGFQERILKRQPLSSPVDIKRYFVSPEESGQICLMACVLGKNGEIFFPNLDDSKMKTFSSIAEDFLGILGTKAFLCNSEQEAREMARNFTNDSSGYPVYFFNSDTSGEKPYEEFFTPNEEVDNIRFSGLGVVTKRASIMLESIDYLINDLNALFDSQYLSKSGIIQLIEKYIPEFGHIEKGKNLDQRM